MKFFARHPPSSQSTRPKNNWQHEMIPENVVFHILLCLPAASLLRFRSVCKLWLSIIDSSHFISQHAHRISDSNDNNLIVMHDLDDPSTTFSFSFISVHNLQLSKYAEFTPAGGDDELDYVGKLRTLASSVHGIVCLIHTKARKDAFRCSRIDVVSLWNPATKQSTVLPPPPQCEINEAYIEYGFGFDVKTNDYKLVRYVSVIIDHPMSRSKPLKSQGEVYCLSTNSWRVIETDVLLNFLVTSNPGKPFLNEIYCLLGFNPHKSGYSIISFNFSNESFGIISVPEFDANGTPVLTYLREKIAFIDRVFDYSNCRSYHFKIWVLDEYGAKESWTKLYSITLDQGGEPLGFSMDGKLILQKDKDPHTFFLYDPLTQEVNEVTTPEHVYEVAMYKESLISVKSASGVKKRNGL